MAVFFYRKYSPVLSHSCFQNWFFPVRLDSGRCSLYNDVAGHSVSVRSNERAAVPLQKRRALEKSKDGQNGRMAL